MPDCNPNPRRYSEEESRMKGVAFSEDIVLLPIPEIPEDDNCPETDIPPEAQVRVNQRIVFSTVTQTIDRIIDRIVNRFADVVKEVTKTITVTDTVTNTVTSTVTQTITQPRVCSPCTPHTATASPSATQPGLPELPAQEQYRGINLRQWSSMNDYCNERRGDTTTSINAYLYVPIGDTYASESDDSRDDHCGDLPAFFYTAAKNYFVGNGLYVYMANLCFQNRTLQNSSPFLFTIDSGGIPHQVFPTC